MNASNQKILKNKNPSKALSCCFGLMAFLMCSHVSASLESYDQNDVPPLWSVTATIGYGNFENMYDNEGQTPVARLALHRRFLDIKNLADMGLELGIQNGNTMRLNVSQADLDLLGGSPVQTSVNPIIDLLVTFTGKPLLGSPFFAQIKGGAAYRSWRFEDRSSINPLSNVAGELQAGFGISLSKISKLSLLYQGIYGGYSNFIVDATNEVGQVSSIPIQNNILLSLNVTV